ncbi:hypothetical protein LTR36_007237 [Oleoguttula mirabilis]|uniref:Ubiquitin-like domain-containing protein n=1 Tax=Oleoguttula mirabilis TaxID=1507867 RepID=A0AAV9JAA2_9PEZI|nr:hypothetical protein LTR36_007237 [Oleoguttula mirabilis]
MGGIPFRPPPALTVNDNPQPPDQLLSPDIMSARNAQTLPLQVKTRKGTAGNDQIYVSRGNGQLYQSLKIGFKRTVRVADNGKPNELPPDMGAFPIYRKEDYTDLPTHVAGNKGFLIPMYQREAMWIKFSAGQPFAVKIYIGGMNAISGEIGGEDEVTMMKRLQLMQEKEPVQDYVAVPGQLWLDGIACPDGHVRQFVAMPLGKGYSVEAQLTGEEVIGGIQFEVTPSKVFTKNDMSGECSSCSATMFPVYIRGPDGTTISAMISEDDYVEDLKMFIAQHQGIPVDQQRLVYRGTQLEDHEYLRDLGVGTNHTIHLALRMRGGASLEAEMGIAAGGLIKQTIVRDHCKEGIWDSTKTEIFTVSILNSAVFKQLTGKDPPPTPITARAYAALGYPYFSIFKETVSGIGGDFEQVQSVNQLDRRGVKTKGKTDAVAEVTQGTQNPIVVLDHKGRRVGFRPVREIEREVREKFPHFRL